MTTHLSTRLVWHDRAWDGHICDHPSKNAFCTVHEHIREARKDSVEDAAAAKTLIEVQKQGWQPPCSRDPVAFSAIGYPSDAFCRNVVGDPGLPGDRARLALRVETLVSPRDSKTGKTL